jgi:hypothetical protein
MPRIPSREEPYHSVAKCNRHWKTKREFVTKAANKASHVDGSHYLLVCVTPKGNIEVHASEHFYDDSNQQRADGVVNWDVLRKRAAVIQSKNEERWTEVERQEKRFGQEGDEEEDDDDDEGEGPSMTEIKVEEYAGTAVGPGQLMSTFSAAKPTPARPISSILVTPHSLEKEYCNRFASLGQSVCANILKAWIKVVEPKKQTKFPYKDKKGNEGRPPPWWPRAMRHIEPDHLHKDERPRLLASIIQKASSPRSERSRLPASPENRELTISRLHFATAEIGSSIPPRQHYELRQIYLIAKEVRKANEDRLRGRSTTRDSDDGAWGELIIEFFEKSTFAPAPSTATVAPSSKRAYEHEYETPSRLVADKENVDYSEPRPVKRSKVAELHHVQTQALAPLTSHQNVYSAVHYVEPHTPTWTANMAPIAVPQPPVVAQPSSTPSSLSSSQQSQQSQQQHAQAQAQAQAQQAHHQQAQAQQQQAHQQQAQQQQAQQQSYYRGFMDVNSHQQYSSSTAASTPPTTTQSYHYQGYAYQPVAYQGYNGYPASQTQSTGTATTAQYAPGYYEGQTFVNDLTGLSA